MQVHPFAAKHSPVYRVVHITGYGDDIISIFVYNDPATNTAIAASGVERF
jgi:hypothetical protein